MAEDIKKTGELVKAKTSSLQKRVSNIVSRGLSDLGLLDIKGSFPDYKSIIPKEFKQICIVDTKTFTYALTRVMWILASDVRLDIKKNTIKLSTFSNIGEASEEIEAELDGEDIIIVCNANLLIDILTEVDSEKIILKMNEHYSTVIIQHVGTDNFINAVFRVGCAYQKE